MEKKKLGKIECASFGYGGYQDACLGLDVTLKMQGSGCGDFIGFWAKSIIDCSENCEWTEKDRDKHMSDMTYKVDELLSQAKVKRVRDLVGKPVEIVLDGNTLKSWRILEEVL